MQRDAGAAAVTWRWWMLCGVGFPHQSGPCWAQSGLMSHQLGAGTASLAEDAMHSWLTHCDASTVRMLGTARTGTRWPWQRQLRRAVHAGTLTCMCSMHHVVVCNAMALQSTMTMQLQLTVRCCCAAACRSWSGCCRMTGSTSRSLWPSPQQEQHCSSQVRQQDGIEGIARPAVCAYSMLQIESITGIIQHQMKKLLRK